MPVEAIQEAAHVRVLVNEEAPVCLGGATPERVLVGLIVEEGVQTRVLKREEGALVERAMVGSDCCSGSGLVGRIHEVVVIDVASCFSTSLWGRIVGSLVVPPLTLEVIA